MVVSFDDNILFFKTNWFSYSIRDGSVSNKQLLRHDDVGLVSMDGWR